MINKAKYLLIHSVVCVSLINSTLSLPIFLSPSLSLSIYIYIYTGHWHDRVFANGPEDLSLIPGRAIPKIQIMRLDASLLNTLHYKVRIKGKVEQSRERSSFKYINLIYLYSLLSLYNNSILDSEHSPCYIALGSPQTHKWFSCYTHTHTHTYIYIYIYWQFLTNEVIRLWIDEKLTVTKHRRLYVYALLTYIYIYIYREREREREREKEREIYIKRKRSYKR